MIDDTCVDQSTIEECSNASSAFTTIKPHVWSYLQGNDVADEAQEGNVSAIGNGKESKHYYNETDGAEDAQDYLRREHRLGRQVLLMEPNNLKDNHEQCEEP